MSRGVGVGGVCEPGLIRGSEVVRRVSGGTGTTLLMGDGTLCFLKWWTGFVCFTWFSSEEVFPADTERLFRGRYGRKKWYHSFYQEHYGRKK